MARKYTRDNRGRFASTGTGATARGGRLKTASGNKRETKKIAAMSGDRMSSVPKGTIGRTRKQREITMIDRPQAQRPAYNAGRAKQQAAIAARKAPKQAAAKRVKAAAPANTVANKTGQSKTLNKFNSRPAGTKVLNSKNQLVPSPTRVPLRVAGKGSNEADRAFGRVATKAARSRAIAAKPAAKAVAKVNLSQTAFERRAKITEKRARAAEKAVAGVDRAYTANRRAFRTADALRSAADSYASYARRGKNNPDFTAADLFKGRAKRSTAPKLSKSEKAAATRRANADQRFRDNVRRMEADRRRR